MAHAEVLGKTLTAPLLAMCPSLKQSQHPGRKDTWSGQPGLRAHPSPARQDQENDSSTRWGWTISPKEKHNGQKSNRGP